MTQVSQPPVKPRKATISPYGIPGRRFPFVALSPEEEPRIRVECGRALDSVQPMVRKIVWGLSDSSCTNEDREDISQECLTSLYTNSLPRFDTQRGTRLSTFLYTCTMNFARQASYRTSRQNRTHNLATHPLPDSDEFAALAYDRAVELKAERMRHDLLSHPEKFLTPCQAVVFTAWITHPSADSTELARALGYKRPASLQNMIRRVRARVVEQLEAGRFE